jgi:hypothetical protein
MSSVDKYSFKSSTAQSPLKKYYESDIDPYSPAIVEDLLQVRYFRAGKNNKEEKKFIDMHHNIKYKRESTSGGTYKT